MKEWGHVIRQSFALPKMWARVVIGEEFSRGEGI